MKRWGLVIFLLFMFLNLNLVGATEEKVPLCLMATSTYDLDIPTDFSPNDNMTATQTNWFLCFIFLAAMCIMSSDLKLMLVGMGFLGIAVVILNYQDFLQLF